MASSNSKKTSRKQRVVNPCRARHGAKSNGRDRASTLALPASRGVQKELSCLSPVHHKRELAQRATHRQTQFPAPPHPRPHNNLFSPPLAPSHATPRNLPR
ncbi:hypothetical protein COCC4DRAFT_62289 [Bipolaris maydis ATCC 48331]|uniref:Uncharacterized protein n=2 Tax=Cochliobolus heterostrophus TaxID=5016 RepID=M2UT91_COCH5|nr:uncharacterized protein COCC4DRAFT_62289 [Bipolaris maydis ATCC 48331]EMD96791.1 hypothetical protein COCHEDRAFT_1084787 [Bipolaris maydis C5]ENI03658.1 hypothetical protein COCC4DRAFT_62289 [Bipolaris maydis ATCC 48331]